MRYFPFGHVKLLVTLRALLNHSVKGLYTSSNGTMWWRPNNHGVGACSVLPGCARRRWSQRTLDTCSEDSFLSPPYRSQGRDKVRDGEVDDNDMTEEISKMTFLEIHNTQSVGARHFCPWRTPGVMSPQQSAGAVKAIGATRVDYVTPTDARWLFLMTIGSALIGQFCRLFIMAHAATQSERACTKTPSCQVNRQRMGPCFYMCIIRGLVLRLSYCVSFQPIITTSLSRRRGRSFCTPWLSRLGRVVQQGGWHPRKIGSVQQSECMR